MPYNQPYTIHMHILITGAFGFVGTNLSRAFKASSHHLIAVDVFEPDNHLYDEVFNWDSLTELNWEKIDAIIHLAGKAHDTKNTTADIEYFKINLGLTQQIFTWFQKASATKFIFFSSVKAVADQVLDKQLDENETPDPKTVYGRSKLAAEQYIQDCHLTEEKQVFILRPCMIHGPGNKGNLNLLYNMVQKGIPWPLGKFENRRSFTSVDNLNYILSEILKHPIEQGIYHIADDEAVSTNRLIELIADSLGHKAKIWYLNKKTIQLIARLGDLIHLPLNSERLQKLSESYVVSNKKIKYTLDVDKLPFRAEEGLKNTLKSFR